MCENVAAKADIIHISHTLSMKCRQPSSVGADKCDSGILVIAPQMVTLAFVEVDTTYQSLQT